MSEQTPSNTSSLADILRNSNCFHSNSAKEMVEAVKKYFRSAAKTEQEKKIPAPIQSAGKGSEGPLPATRTDGELFKSCLPADLYLDKVLIPKNEGYGSQSTIKIDSGPIKVLPQPSLSPDLLLDQNTIIYPSNNPQPSIKNDPEPTKLQPKKELTLGNFPVNRDKQILNWFYKQLAEDYTLLMPLSPSKKSSAFPETPKRCSLEDIHEADLQYGLNFFPRIHPDYLYRWDSQKGVSYGGKSRPNLLIVLDSSGSMPNPKNYFSYALVSGMIAEKAALDQSNKVGVINFSDEAIYQPFTTNSDDIDEALAYYHGGNTIIPAELIYDVVKKHNHSVHILMITDAQIQNLIDEIGCLEDSLKLAKGGGTIFLLNSYSQNSKRLEEIGYDLVPVQSAANLAQLALNKSEEVFYNA